MHEKRLVHCSSVNGNINNFREVIEKRKKLNMEPYLVFDIIDSQENGDESNG